MEMRSFHKASWLVHAPSKAENIRALKGDQSNWKPPQKKLHELELPAVPGLDDLSTPCKALHLQSPTLSSLESSVTLGLAHLCRSCVNSVALMAIVLKAQSSQKLAGTWRLVHGFS